MAQLIYTIDDSKLQHFKNGFLKERPVPIDHNTGLPIMSENNWIKEWGKRQFVSSYEAGIRRLAAQNAGTDNNIVE